MDKLPHEVLARILQFVCVSKKVLTLDTIGPDEPDEDETSWEPWLEVDRDAVTTRARGLRSSSPVPGIRVDVFRPFQVLFRYCRESTDAFSITDYRLVAKSWDEMGTQMFYRWNEFHFPVWTIQAHSTERPFEFTRLVNVSVNVDWWSLPNTIETVSGCTSLRKLKIWFDEHADMRGFDTDGSGYERLEKEARDADVHTIFAPLQALPRLEVQMLCWEPERMPEWALDDTLCSPCRVLQDRLDRGEHLSPGQ